MVNGETLGAKLSQNLRMQEVRKQEVPQGISVCRRLGTKSHARKLP